MISAFGFRRGALTYPIRIFTALRRAVEPAADRMATLGILTFDHFAARLLLPSGRGAGA